MSDLNESQLDELAKRIAAQLKSQEDAKANANPNAYVLDALDAKAAKDEAFVRSLGLGTEEERVPDSMPSGEGGFAGGLGTRNEEPA